MLPFLHDKLDRAGGMFFGWRSNLDLGYFVSATMLRHVDFERSQSSCQPMTGRMENANHHGPHGTSKIHADGFNYPPQSLAF
jgi:hypothetical protein